MSDNLSFNTHHEGVIRCGRSTRLRGMRQLFRILVFIAFSLGLLAFQEYISFKFPIKTDRYKHSFLQHIPDGVDAYLLLLESRFRSQNSAMSAEEIHDIVTVASSKYGVDPCLIQAVAIYESGLNPNTITTTGAMGLMALQPATAKELALRDPFDPHGNIDAGTRLLKQLSEMFNSNMDLILASYNAGPDAVRRFAGVPPFRETTDYVKHVGHIYGFCKADTRALPSRSANN